MLEEETGFDHSYCMNVYQCKQKDLQTGLSPSGVFDMHMVLI